MSGPSYDLHIIQDYVRSGRYHITLSAKQGAVSLGMDTGDIEACVLGLTMKDFYKTMEAERMPGLFQDVYRPVFGGWNIYIKLQITSQAVVISFKER